MLEPAWWYQNKETWSCSYLLGHWTGVAYRSQFNQMLSLWQPDGNLCLYQGWRNLFDLIPPDSSGLSPPSFPTERYWLIQPPPLLRKGGGEKEWSVKHHSFREGLLIECMEPLKFHANTFWQKPCTLLKFYPTNQAFVMTGGRICIYVSGEPRNVHSSQSFPGTHCLICL